MIAPKSESPAAHIPALLPSPTQILSYTQLCPHIHTLPTTTTHSTTVSPTAKYSLSTKRSLHIQRSVRRLFLFASRANQRCFHHTFTPILCFHFLHTRRFRHRPVGRDLKAFRLFSSLYGQSLTRLCFLYRLALHLNLPTKYQFTQSKFFNLKSSKIANRKIHSRFSVVLRPASIPFNHHRGSPTRLRLSNSHITEYCTTKNTTNHNNLSLIVNTCCRIAHLVSSVRT